VGQINILLHAESCNIEYIFGELEKKCKEFYEEVYDQEHPDMDAMEIRGRLDFLDDLQADALEAKMQEYCKKVDTDEIEGCYVNTNAEIKIAHREEPITQALITIAMYGQLTMINHSLITDVTTVLGKILPAARKTMLTYTSFSALMRGSDNYYTGPLIHIETSPRVSAVSVNESAKPLDLSTFSKKREKLAPKDNPKEYFKIGDIKKSS
jgi:hypothetical protein